MAGYLGNIPSAVPLTSADIADGIITSAKIVDGTIVNADINASAGIDSTKISGLSSDFVLLNTQTITTASTVSSVSVNSVFTTTYRAYKIVFSNIATNGSSTANNNIIFQVKDTSNNTIGGTNYNYVGYIQTQGTNISSSSANAQAAVPIVSNCFGDADLPISGYIYIFNPRSGVRTNFITRIMYHSTGGFSSYKQAYSIQQSNVEIGGFLIQADGNATQIKGATGSGFIKTYGLL